MLMTTDPTNAYRLRIASSVGARDGIALELIARDASGEVIAEVFHDDVSGAMTFAMFHDTAIPLGVLEWFLEEARRAKLGGDH